MQNGMAILENNLLVSCKTKYVAIILGTNCTTGHFSRENKTFHTKLYTHTPKRFIYNGLKLKTTQTF